LEVQCRLLVTLIFISYLDYEMAELGEG
jgi:hypothetical protein